MKTISTTAGVTEAAKVFAANGYDELQKAADVLEGRLPELNRLTVRWNGIEVIGASVACKRPENEEEMKALLRMLLEVLDAPDVPDPEVLGDRPVL